MINLVGNAIKFTQSGEVRVEVKADENLKKILIQVHDSGVGIKESDRKDLFKTFSQTEAGKNAGTGTGLGLAISRDYAKLLGGGIALVSSVESLGSCFQFDFKFTIPADCTEEATETLFATKVLSPQHLGTRLLVVDDHPVNRQIFNELFTGLGFTVEEAVDGESAIKCVEQSIPKVILMDFVLPKMNGIEATRIIRAKHSKEKITIIGISASAFLEDKEQFLHAGADAFLSKPFRNQELIKLIATHTGLQFEEVNSNEEANKVCEKEIGISVDVLPALWKDSFKEAILTGNISQLRRLGEEAKGYNKEVSKKVISAASQYDIDYLRRLQSDWDRSPV